MTHTWWCLRSERIAARWRLLFGLFLVLVCSSGWFAPALWAQQIAHYSGTQTALASGMEGPKGVAVDGSGNVYIIVNNANNSGVWSVMKWPWTGSGYGTWITVASGWTGLNTPMGIAVDDTENVYISANDSVLKVPWTGSGYGPQTTVATGLNHPWGVAVDANGNVYIAELGNNRVVMVRWEGGNNYSPLSPLVSGLSYPAGLAMDASGNLYIADNGHNQVVKVPWIGSSWGSQTTVVGGLDQPDYVAVDANGNVFVDDKSIRTLEVPWTGSGYGPLMTLLDQTTNGASFIPFGEAADTNGNVYIADSGNGYVWKVQQGGPNLGNVNVGSSKTAMLLFGFDQTDNQVLAASSSQFFSAVETSNDFHVDSGTCINTSGGTTFNPGDVCSANVTFTPKMAGPRYGAVGLMDWNTNIIAVGNVQGVGVAPQVNFLPGAQSTVAASLNKPAAVAVDSSGVLYIADTFSNRVLMETLSAGSYHQHTVLTSTLALPGGVAVDGFGRVYIADSNHGRVLVETPVPDGSYGIGSWAETTLGIGLSHPTGMAVDGFGTVYIADTGLGQVLKETPSNGSYIQSVVASGLADPQGVAVDGSGNVYIADMGNNRVLMETPIANGIYSMATQFTGLNQPYGVAVDGSGNVYIADMANDRVLKETLSNGSYTQSLIADGLAYPQGVAVDGSGNVYITDSYGNRVLKEDFVDPPSLSFNSTAVGVPSSDSPQTVTVANIGNATLSFPIPVSGNNPSIASNFSLDSTGATACPLVTSGDSAGSLAAGASCTLPISFVPEAVGTITGSLVLTDTNKNAAAPNYATQTISLSGTGTASTPVVTVSAVSVSYGASNVALSATVFYSGSPAPTGAFSFQVDSGATVTATCTGSSSPLSCTASYAISSLAAGGHTIAGSLAADTNYNAATGTGTLTVTQAAVTATAGRYSGMYDGSAHAPSVCAVTGSYTGDLTCANNPATVGADVSSGTITPVVSGTGVSNFAITNVNGSFSITQASSTVTVSCPASVTYNGAAQSPCSATATGAGSLNQPLTVSYGSNINAGTATAGASYSGDTNHTGSSNSTTFTITQAAVIPIIVPASLTQTYSGSSEVVTVQSPVSYGVTYTSTPDPTIYPTSATGPANPGSYSVLVTVTDPNYIGSTSGTLTINQLSPALSLTRESGSPEPSPYGTRVYFDLTTASTPRCPTGAVNFYVDYVDSGSTPASTVTLGGTNCTQPVVFSTATLTPTTGGQPHSITAIYTGDTYYAGATSNAASQDVTADGTAVTLATTGTSVYVGDTITFTATVAPTTNVDGGAQAPAGTVQFNAVTVDSQGHVTGTLATLGSGQLSATAPYMATFNYSSLAAGSHNVQAVYLNTGGLFAGSSSAVGVETVNRIVPTITWQPSVPSIVYGTPLSAGQLNATAADTHNNVNPIPGTFTYDSPVGTVLPVGSKNVTVTFNPTDTNTYTTQTATATITVTPATLTVTADNQSRSYGAGNPAFTFQYSGFVNGDTAGSVTTAPACGTAATASSPVGAYDITCSGGVAPNYSFHYAKGTLTIGKAALTVAAGNAVMAYGAALPSLGGALTGVVTGDSITASYSTTATSASAPGSYPIVPALIDPQNKLADYILTSINGTLTINKAASVAALQTSVADILVQNNVTFTAHLASSTSGMPTGSVSFLDGTTSLGKGTLDNSGTAALTLSTLTVGSHAITAVYAGDTNFTGIASAALTETVQDFQFIIRGGGASIVVQPGGAGAYQFQVSPVNGPTFPSAVTLSLSGLPPGTTYTITPSTIAAGSGAQTITVRVQTTLTAGLRKPLGGRTGVVFALALLPMLGMVRLRRALAGHAKRVALLLCLLLAVGILGMSACGGGSGFLNRAPQTYTMQLNATSGALQHSATLNLTIQ